LIFVEGVSISLPDPQSGELLGFGKILRDVTERKITEDNLKTLTRTLDQSVVFIARWDGLITYWTAGCQALYGWTPEEAQGQRADDLLQTSKAIPHEAIQAQLQATGTWQGELQQKRKDGTLVYVSAHWTMLSPNPDEEPSIIATHTDISSRLQMQVQLEQANDQLKKMAFELERSNAELEEFARIASHDLSAPITSTRWLVDLLANRHAAALDGDGKNILGQVSQGLERMMNLVEAILAHARAGINPIGTSVLTSADEALKIAMQNLSKDLSLSEAELSQDPLPQLYIEMQPLAQLFQNLLSNAIKYRRPDTPLHIRVEATRKDNLWRIGVSDNGMGVEKDWLERIFQPMQRPNRPEISGSGIGLATCRKIVNRAGGEIWVESELGKGSTFYFTLIGADA
jgi:PAS domain S-box-containing protein